MRRSWATGDGTIAGRTEARKLMRAATRTITRFWRSWQRSTAQQLSKTDQLNYDLFQKRYADRIEQYKVRWFLMSFNQREGPQTSDDLGSSLRFETVKDYEDWLARLRAHPHGAGPITALLREGIRERMVHPRVIMERIPAQIDKQIVSDPTQSGFYKPFKSFPSAISQADQQRLQQDARKAVEQQVVPAFTKFKQFFVSEYLPACYDKVGAWQLPHGEELYTQMIRHYTTTNETPEEVHQIGLKEVARINGEMDRVMQQTGFKGSRDEFFKFLRTDPSSSIRRRRSCLRLIKPWLRPLIRIW